MDLGEIVQDTITKLEGYPSADDDNRLRHGNVVYDAMHLLLHQVNDTEPDSKGDPNLQGAGGRLWYELLIESRGQCRTDILSNSRRKLTHWLRSHYAHLLSESADAHTFDIFLSYHSSDKPAVHEIANRLSRRGLKVWLDEWELRPGLTWMDALERIIEACGSAAVCVGPHGVGPWQEPEVRALLRRIVREKKKGKTVPFIPTLLPGAPDDVKLPPFLEDFTRVDLRQGLTDVGLAKLMWGITGQKPESHTNYVARESQSAAARLIDDMQTARLDPEFDESILGEVIWHVSPGKNWKRLELRESYRWDLLCGAIIKADRAIIKSIHERISSTKAQFAIEGVALLIHTITNMLSKDSDVSVQFVGTLSDACFAETPAKIKLSDEQVDAVFDIACERDVHAVAEFFRDIYHDSPPEPGKEL